MPIHTQFQIKNDVLYVKSSGRNESLSEILAYANSLIEEAQQHHTQKILIDETELIYGAQSYEIFESATMIADTVPQLMNIVMVINPAQARQAELWETAAINRGMTVYITDSFEDAEIWLGIKSARLPHIEDTLSAFLNANQQTLGDKLLGLYIYGSYLTGDFSIGISDLDMTAVLTDDLREADLANLKAMHEQFAADHPSFAGRIETQYLSKAALQTFRTVRHPMANISPGEPFHLIEGGPEWLSNWWMILDHGRVLYGPEPTAVIPPIADEEFFEVIRSYVEDAREWGAKYTHLAGQAYTMLTMFRALYTLTHRKHVSKLTAARWAQETYPQYTGMIEKAVYWREHHAEATDDDPAVSHPIVMEIVEFVCGECERLT